MRDRCIIMKTGCQTLCRDSQPELKSRGLVTDAMKDVQMSLQLDTSSLKDASDPSKTDFAGITGMLTQLIQVMSAGQDIYFDNREWAGKLAPAINNELGRIAREAAYR